MQHETLSLDETDCFSSLFIDYISEKPELKPFYSAFPNIENFEQAIKNRNFDDTKRSVLVDVLREQYGALNQSSKVTGNIDLLSKNTTFTITTGHQLNLLTGPLYVIYKLVTVINACNALKKQYPAYDFVPIYWMASEDHDFDEINHFYLDGQKHEWKTDQSGAVGRFNLNDLEDLFKKLPSGIDFFEEAYASETLSGAVRHYVNHLFGEHGLVVIDADNPKLKQEFSHVIADDLFKHSSLSATQKDTKELEALGYKSQVNAREINFFYLHEDTRERIERDGESFSVLNSELKFSESEMKDLIASHPERFSPNVILRPLYQETILPNLAYVGGPSEAVYWLQLKSVFAHFKTPFPLLMPRNFALVVPSAVASKWKKTNLQTKYLFISTEMALAKWIEANASVDLSYGEEIKKIESVYSELEQKSEKIDPTLKQHLEALNATSKKKLAAAEKKLARAEKRKHVDKERQIRTVKDALFPNGSLQERRDNFLNFYLKDQNFIESLVDTFDPFHYEMYVIKE